MSDHYHDEARDKVGKWTVGALPDMKMSLEGRPPVTISGDPMAAARQYFRAEALDRAANQSEGSRELLVFLPPGEFLAMAEDAAPVAFSEEAVAEVLEQGEKFDDVPFLAFKHDGEGVATVVGHEGRHRARALQSIGVRLMPVRLMSQSGGGGNAIRWGRQATPGFDRIDGVWPTRLRGESGGEIAFPVTDARR